MGQYLTEKQQKFLDVLYEEARGDARVAKELAGYSPNVSTSSVTGPLAEEIAELTRKFIAQTSTKAMFAMYSALEDPTELGIKEKLSAAKDLLDRAGFAKTDKVEVTTKDPLFILPAKKEEDE